MHTTHPLSTLFACAGLLALVGCGGGGDALGPAAEPGQAAVAAAVATDLSTVYDWANDLVTHIVPENNVYGKSPWYLTWAGVNGATAYTNKTDCSSFVSLVVRQTYGLTELDMKAWLDAYNPSSARWHDQIVAGNGFERRLKVWDIQRGDLVAIKYLDGSSGGSGHMMIVANAPAQMTPKAPLQGTTLQYAMTVIDSTSSPHGVGDSRRLSDGTELTGAGTGTFRLYADAEGNLTGYTWSLSSGSKYYTPDLRSLVAGQIIRTAPAQ